MKKPNIIDRQSGKTVTYKEVFLGHCVGIGLRQRGKEDLHICIDWLVEDDGTWFIFGEHGPSSSWIPEMMEQLSKALVWIQINALPDISEYDYHKGRQFGWKFRE